MSQWYEQEKKDISFSEDGTEMHIYLYSDDFGAVYASVMVADVEEKLLLLKKEIKNNGNK